MKNSTLKQRVTARAKIDNEDRKQSPTKTKIDSIKVTANIIRDKKDEGPYNQKGKNGVKD